MTQVYRGAPSGFGYSERSLCSGHVTSQAETVKDRRSPLGSVASPGLVLMECRVEAVCAPRPAQPHYHSQHGLSAPNPTTSLLPCNEGCGPRSPRWRRKTCGGQSFPVLGCPPVQP